VLNFIFKVLPMRILGNEPYKWSPTEGLQLASSTIRVGTKGSSKGAEAVLMVSIGGEGDGGCRGKEIAEVLKGVVGRETDIGRHRGRDWDRDGRNNKGRRCRE
jgi:hypothetical protein